MTKFIYLESRPALKGKAREFGASYRRMSVIELEPGFDGIPAMISPRAKGVRRIVREATLSVGKTSRSEGFRVREELRALACELNNLTK